MTPIGSKVNDPFVKGTDPVNTVKKQDATDAPANQPAEVKAPAKFPDTKDSLIKMDMKAGKPASAPLDLKLDDTNDPKPTEPKHERRATERKGTLAVGWGYGREIYAPSDMHFKGSDHDFTLTGVKAKDRPSAFSFDTYFNPAKLSIPQYMMDVTYFPTDNIYLEFSPNHHMKWVAEADQMVKINGTISPEASPTMAGNYNGEYINLNQIFGNLEHTDGYNATLFGAGVIHPLWESKNGKFAVSMKGGVQAGTIVTKSDVRMFGKGDNHPFKLDGFAYGAKAGVRVDLFRNFFAEMNTEFLRGHVSGFHTTGEAGDVGSHTIDGVNTYVTVGYQAPIQDFNPKNWFHKK